MRRAAALLSAAAGAAACADDVDCSLNGVCTGGACVCDRPWTGPTCAVIIRRPARPGGLYGYAPNVSSWGGNVVRGGDGLYHLFVAEMQAGGLSGWARNSECTHAVSPAMQGPYTRRATALGRFCHNPVALRAADGTYLLFHIGAGGGNGNSSAFMHHAASPDGPWVPAAAAPHCNNPAPAFHPNGTLFVICHNGGHNHMSITSAASWRSAQWAPQRRLGNPASAGAGRLWEDPFLWWDARGRWHALFHVFTKERWPAMFTSGHAFSADGLEWTFSPVEPYNSTIDFTDGTSITMATRERPKLVFADADAARAAPIGVITGCSSQPVGPGCDSCDMGACSQCKVTHGRDWTYTVLQPFDGYDV